MMQISLFFSGLLFLIFLSFTAFIELSDTSRITESSRVPETQLTLFPNQCIDTMKQSRDQARLDPTAPETEAMIRSQVQTISSIGANCVAISTPFDDEFIPYLSKWVEEARNAGLKVWFRGNWAEWEGWYGYPKNQTTDEHIRANVRFITTHPELFADGDIFSPNTEPELGNPFNPIDTPEKHALMQSYIAKEQIEVRNAFVRIKKDVQTSWVSLSGGVAKMIIDKKTIDALGNVVTLDHYVSDPAGLTEYIQFYNKNFGARIVFGEFGAPIPDINGTFTPKKQAEFVDKLFWELFLSRDLIDGVNYWTLTDSSTALLDQNGVAKPVVEVVKKYYLPGKIIVQVRNKDDSPISGAIISINNKLFTKSSDVHGNAEFLLPQGSYTVTVKHPEGNSLKKKIILSENTEMTLESKFTYPTSGFRTILLWLLRKA